MKYVIYIFTLVLSFTTFAQDEHWTIEDIPEQPLSNNFSGSFNTGNSDFMFFKKKVEHYNSRFGSQKPLGDLKYQNLGKLYNMHPHQVCMQLEVSCQAKLEKVPDCTLDKGDGKIICNGLVYTRDKTINTSGRSILKGTTPSSQSSQKKDSVEAVQN